MTEEGFWKVFSVGVRSEQAFIAFCICQLRRILLVKLIISKLTAYL